MPNKRIDDLDTLSTELKNTDNFIVGSGSLTRKINFGTIRSSISNMTGSLNVSGSTNLIGKTSITGSLNVSGPTNLVGKTSITGSLNVSYDNGVSSISLYGKKYNSTTTYTPVYNPSSGNYEVNLESEIDVKNSDYDGNFAVDMTGLTESYVVSILLPDIGSVIGRYIKLKIKFNNTQTVLNNNNDISLQVGGFSIGSIHTVASGFLIRTDCTATVILKKDATYTLIYSQIENGKVENEYTSTSTFNTDYVSDIGSVFSRFGGKISVSAVTDWPSGLSEIVNFDVGQNRVCYPIISLATESPEPFQGSFSILHDTTSNLLRVYGSGSVNINSGLTLNYITNEIGEYL